MHTFAALSFVIGASALTVPRSTCSFELTASGGKSGTIGQLSDGQNRIGGGLAASTFSISNGGITDAAGRGCILTPSVEQFQCDQGVGPTYGFAIESNGTLTSGGSSVFYACPASETEWNLYTTPVIGQLKCVEIALTASGCGASSSSSVVTQPASTVTVYVTGDCGVASTASATTTGGFESASPPAIAESSTTQLPLESSAFPAATEISTPADVESTTSPIVIASSSVPAVTSTSTISIATYETSASTVYVTSSSSPYESIATSRAASSSAIATPSETPVSVAQSTAVAVIPSSSRAPYSNTTMGSTSSSVATATGSSSSCVATTLTGSDTSGNYQYPHLIIPVSSTTPSTAAGTQYFGTISSNTSTIYNFDIPSSYSGSTCNLIFLLPLHSQLETSSYTSSGAGTIEFEQLSSPATSATTYDNAPSVEKDLGEFTIIEGSSTLIESFACQAGETVSYELKAVGDTYLYYFQDWNPSPIGLFITEC